MPKVKTDALQEGMVVASDIKNLDDMLLAPAGTELTARHIRVLRTWGVTEVTVRDAGEGETEADPLSRLDPRVARRLEAELSQLFWDHDRTHPAQQEVFRLALLRRARQTLRDAHRTPTLEPQTHPRA